MTKFPQKSDHSRNSLPFGTLPSKIYSISLQFEDPLEVVKIEIIFLLVGFDGKKVRFSDL